MLRPFVAPQTSVLHSAARGTVWLFAMRAGEKTFTFIQTVILAHLLAPRDLGLFGIILIAVSSLDLISLMGLKSALVQKKDETAEDMDTVWTTLIGQSALNASILFLLAGVIASAFHEPRAASLIRGFSAAILLDGFINIGIVYFDKKLEFHKQFWFFASSTAMEFATVVTLAFIYRNVWAMVIGAIVGRVTRVVSSYILEAYRPRIRWSLRHFRSLFVFGKWQWISTALTFAILNGDNIFVGKVLGTAALGIYAVAFSAGNIARNDIGVILTRVMFPTFSILQNDEAQLKNAYLKVTRAMTMLVFPLTVGIFVLAPEFVLGLLGEKWLPCAAVIRVLAFVGMFNAILSRSGAVLRGRGTPRLATASETIYLAIAAAVIYPLAKTLWIAGVATAVLCGSFAGWLYVERKVIKTLQLYVGDLWSAIRLNLAAAVFMGAILQGLKVTLGGVRPLILLITFPVLGIGLYGGFLYLLNSVKTDKSTAVAS